MMIMRGNPFTQFNHQIHSINSTQTKTVNNIKENAATTLRKKASMYLYELTPKAKARVNFDELL